MTILLLSFLTTVAIFAVGGAVAIMLGMTDMNPDCDEK